MVYICGCALSLSLVFFFRGQRETCLEKTNVRWRRSSKKSKDAMDRGGCRDRKEEQMDTFTSGYISQTVEQEGLVPEGRTRTRCLLVGRRSEQTTTSSDQRGPAIESNLCGPSNARRSYRRTFERLEPQRSSCRALSDAAAIRNVGTKEIYRQTAIGVGISTGQNLNLERCPCTFCSRLFARIYFVNRGRADIG